MKTCPACHKSYSDDTLNFCLDDGVALQALANPGDMATEVLHHPTDAGKVFATARGSAAITERLQTGTAAGHHSPKWRKSALPWIIGIAAALGLVLLLAAGGIGALVYFNLKPSPSGTETASETQTDDDQNSNGWTSEKKTAETEKSGALTMANYRRLKDGISYQEAVAILGEGALQPGFEELGDAGIDMKMYRWEGADFSFIMLTFTGGKLNARSQHGLSENVKTELTEAKFHRLKQDMTYDEMVRILGSEGSETNYNNFLGMSMATYEWKADENSYITVMFVNDKAQSISRYGLK